jgi:hypothetical protein
MAGAADTEHVGKVKVPDAFEATEQLRATAPVNPLVGAMVMDEDPGVPGVVMMMGPPASVNPGAVAAVTSTGMLVVAVVPPEVPVICSV